MLTVETTHGVPHHLPGTNEQLEEFAERMGLPFEATRGGRGPTYPEYQLTLQQMMVQMVKTAQSAKTPKRAAE